MPDCALVEAQAAVLHTLEAGRVAGAAGDHQQAALQRQHEWRLAGSDRCDRGGGRREVGNYRQECTAIKSAAQEDFDAIVKGLIRVAGASLHHLNDQRCTALHLAAKNGHIGVVRILL